ncbi:MAG: KamA family radical SAM protein [Cyanophyceae cyanobacterium]
MDSSLVQARTGHAHWSAIPDAQWHQWQWQLSNRLNTAEELGELISLTQDELAGLQAEGKFRVDITPYFASLIDPKDPNCPIRRQVIPTGRELEAFDGMRLDSLGEDHESPVPGIVHRYPDRVLMLVTTHCASYCRFCTRSRMVGDPTQAFGKEDFERQIQYLVDHPEIRDVLLSGGDPLTLSDTLLEYLLSRLRAIDHIEIIRMSTRVPIFLPQRITPELCETLRKHHPFWLNVHVNHPKELTPEAITALAQLADTGIPLGSQTVLMAGINDHLDIQRQLMHRLVQSRVRPYYLYQCDLVKGAGHFRTPVALGIEIIEGLRGHTSGYAVPTFVVDLPDGGGKVPVMPQYLISQGRQRVVLRNYEGMIVAYDEPPVSHEDTRAAEPSLGTSTGIPTPKGIAGLLGGYADVIHP